MTALGRGRWLGQAVCSAHETSLAVQLGIVHLFYIKKNLPEKIVAIKNESGTSQEIQTRFEGA